MIKNIITIKGTKYYVEFFSSPHKCANITFDEFSLFVEYVVIQDAKNISKLHFLPLDFVCIVNKIFDSKRSTPEKKEYFLVSGAREVKSLYFRLNGITLNYSTSLADIVTQNDKISKDYFHYFLSNGFGLGPFDRNIRFASPFRNVYKLPLQTILYIKDGDIVNEQYLPFSASTDQISSLGEAIEIARSALHHELSSIASNKTISVESSGGIDSSIILSAACNYLNSRKHFGVAAYFPYHEFRYESLYRQKMSSFLNVPVYEEFSLNNLPFSMLMDIEYHSEPAWHSSGYGLAIQLFDKAVRKGANSLLSGHSADYVFCMKTTNFPKIIVPDSSNCIFRGMLTEKLYACANDILVQSRDRFNYFGLSSSWSLECIEPNYFTKYTIKSNTNFFRGSPFMTSSFLSAAHYISMHLDITSYRVQKPIAHCLFSDLLPIDLWKRKGKLDHQALSYRGLRVYLKDIVKLLLSERIFLESLGVDTKWILSHVKRVASNNVDLSVMFYGVLACAIWHYSFFRYRKDPENS